MRDARAHTQYYVFVDRFASGDSSLGGKNPAALDTTRSDPFRYWGGDLAGLLQYIDYIDKLGISCLRISSVFEQMPALALDRGRLSAPYHGQWIADYRRLEPHYLPREEWDRPFADRNTVFDRLVQACKQRGIRLILDVVCDRSNPGGEGWVPGEIWDDGSWQSSTENDTFGWYRRSSYREDEGTGDSPVRFQENRASFRKVMREVLSDWLARGVDGYCFDAVQRLPIWFWQELTACLRLAHPEVSLCGTATARGGWEEAAVDFANQAGMRLMDAGFQRRIVESLCWRDAGGFRRIAHYLDRDEVFEDATSLVTCLENEKTPRLLSQGMPKEHLLLALTLLMTSRGVPCIFYGTESGLHDDTERGNDPYNRPMMREFDLDSPASRALSILTALRRDNLAVQRGHYRTLWLSDDIFVYSRVYAEDRVVVALNRGGAAKIDVAEVPLSNGPWVDVLHGAGVFVHEGQIVDLELPSGAARVFADTRHREHVGTRVLCRLSGYSSRFGESVVVTGNVPELGQWDVEAAPRLHYVNRNLWMGDVYFGVSRGKRVLYKYAVVDERGSVVRESTMPRAADVPQESGEEWADR
ncbi:MAG TPA: alpha-amylase family glycosyl hydrolase, partial [Polyangiaceae bacterium]|nr:alpha-amylase family glycosyl hydrolase [Polyangiaceae bacterium]